MMKINMIGGGFQHVDCSSAWNINKYVHWIKDMSANVSIHIDNSILDNISLCKDTKLRYAWLAESSAIISSFISNVKSNIELIENSYELIFTHDKRLLNISPKMRLVLPNACPWVEEKKIHKKNKIVSMIASNKRMCDGHNYRQEIINKIKNTIVDHYGVGFKYIKTKEEGLNNYYYSIAMENDNYPSIFCEKITDCFATGTIPIFWGTPDIGEIFNENGIIKLTNDFDVNNLSIEMYHDKFEYVKENFDIAINLPTAEDYIYLNYLK